MNRGYRLYKLVAMALAGWMWASVVWAAQVDITAFYEPDPANPGKLDFTNVTPEAYYCERWPHHCARAGLFTVGLPIRYTKVTEKNHADRRKRFYIGLPGPRTVSVSNGVDNFDVVFSLTNVSQELIGNPSGNYGNPVYTQYVAGCQYVLTLGAGTWVSYLWRSRAPSAPWACNSQSDGGSSGYINTVVARNFGVGYTLSLPNPLQLVNGVYRGQVSYSVGDGGEFDLGADVSGLNHHSLTFNFELRVNHHLNVAFPPGAERAVLEPRSGWADWVNRGNRPVKLERDIPFRISASGPFRAYSQCEFEQGGRCAIRSNVDDSLATVDVALTLPGHVQLTNGRPVTDVALPVGQAAGLRLRTVTAAFNQPGKLAFSTAGEAVQRMLDQPGSTWEGIVTVYFEAEI